MTDIWELHSQGYWAVIPTNLIYNKQYDAVMGAGLAKQATQHCPHLASRYGHWLKAQVKYPPGSYIDHGYRVVCFATKHHWKDPSDLELIRSGLVRVGSWVVNDYNATPEGPTPINLAIPRLGCGLGGLKWEDVKPVIQDILPEGRYVFCEE